MNKNEDLIVLKDTDIDSLEQKALQLLKNYSVYKPMVIKGLLFNPHYEITMRKRLVAKRPSISEALATTKLMSGLNEVIQKRTNK